MSADRDRQLVHDASGGPSRGRPEYFHRALAVFGLGALFLVLAATLWFAGQVFLLAFTGILIAVLLHDASSMMEKWLRLPHWLALSLVLLLTAALLVLAGWLLAPHIVDQANQLVADLPSAMQRLRAYLERHGVLQYIAGALPTPERIFGNISDVAARAGTIFSGVLGALVNVVIILFLGIYLAAQPHVYTDSIVKLLPQSRRQRGREVLDELRLTLSLWLRGKLLAMTVVGIATAIGLTLLGVPLALALGVLAGLLDFIPYLGPILAALPALLIAFAHDPTLALYVLVLFVALQSAESYLLSPLVERQTVSLPPALTITMQALMSVPFGLIGVALASPLTAVFAVLIAMLYVQDVLEDQVTLPGEHG